MVMTVQSSINYSVKYQPASYKQLVMFSCMVCRKKVVHEQNNNDCKSTFYCGFKDYTIAEDTVIPLLIFYITFVITLYYFFIWFRLLNLQI